MVVSSVRPIERRARFTRGAGADAAAKLARRDPRRMTRFVKALSQMTTFALGKTLSGASTDPWTKQAVQLAAGGAGRRTAGLRGGTGRRHCVATPRPTSRATVLPDTAWASCSAKREAPVPISISPTIRAMPCAIWSAATSPDSLNAKPASARCSNPPHARLPRRARARSRVGRRQCDISTGTVIESRIPRVAPPSTRWAQRGWP